MAHIQRRENPSGEPRWVVRYQTPDGRERSRSFTRRGDAVAWLDTIGLADKSRRRDPRAGESVTVGEVAERWYLSRVDLAPTTRNRNRGFLDVHVLPRFGEWPVSDLDRDAVQRWVAELSDRGLARASIRKGVTVLRQILELAVSDGLLDMNPASGKTIRLPRDSSTPRDRMRILTATEAVAVADAAGPFYRTHLHAAAQTGMRWGELAGLKTDAVDLLRGEIHVRTQLVEISGRFEVTSQLKTDSSRRTVTIGPTLVELLSEHMGRFRNDSGLVFVGPEGGYLRRSNYATRILKPAAESVGISGLRFHDLRHTHASLLLAAGEPVPAVAERLGHGNPAITMRIYAHALPGSDRELADRVDAIFGTVPTSIAAATGIRRADRTSAEVTELPETLAQQRLSGA